MSAGGENRWRRSGQQNRQNQDARSGTNTPTRDGGKHNSMAGVPGNVWGAGKGKTAAPAERGAPAPQAVSAEAEPHVPVHGFNAAEVKDFLKKRYMEAVADKPSAHYKVQGDSVAKRSSGAWGSRGNMSHLMPNGQDFMTQLKKQLAALEQKPSKT
ncbi:hypothetical protein M011DRAFT_473266 [Sporormia fimetaria CBS 119925]|uniref:Uncharacterized protein n=1 Tax=Sporormia fimetaria CBS 119925 TaxID=1340428 RepID=A0A6A6VQ91_9PLEO|nr:hypothetical protein M011DRAFT_473266 [Sporormia fimetaria CBS 119925]